MNLPNKHINLCISYCRVTIRSQSPKDLGYEPNEPNTMNL